MRDSPAQSVPAKGEHQVSIKVNGQVNNNKNDYTDAADWAEIASAAAQERQEAMNATCDRRRSAASAESA
jgi:hypothetical protein